MFAAFQAFLDKPITQQDQSFEDEEEQAYHFNSTRKRWEQNEMQVNPKIAEQQAQQQNNNSSAGTQSALDVPRIVQKNNFVNPQKNTTSQQDMMQNNASLQPQNHQQSLYNQALKKKQTQQSVRGSHELMSQNNYNGNGSSGILGGGQKQNLSLGLGLGLGEADTQVFEERYILAQATSGGERSEEAATETSILRTHEDFLIQKRQQEPEQLEEDSSNNSNLNSQNINQHHKQNHKQFHHQPQPYPDCTNAEIQIYNQENKNPQMIRAKTPIVSHKDVAILAEDKAKIPHQIRDDDQVDYDNSNRDSSNSNSRFYSGRNHLTGTALINNQNDRSFRNHQNQSQSRSRNRSRVGKSQTQTSGSRQQNTHQDDVHQGYQRNSMSPIKSHDDNNKDHNNTSQESPAKIQQKFKRHNNEGERSISHREGKNSRQRIKQKNGRNTAELVAVDQPRRRRHMASKKSTNTSNMLEEATESCIMGLNMHDKLLLDEEENLSHNQQQMLIPSQGTTDSNRQNRRKSQNLAMGRGGEVAVDQTTITHITQKSERQSSQTTDPYNRLYLDASQRQLTRKQAFEDQKETQDRQQEGECTQRPQISEISNAVAQAMPHRPKKAEQFQMYSTEWKKLRDAKVEQKRTLAKEEEKRKKEVKLSANSKKILPANYKGPLSGYYEQVGKYFEKKNDYEKRSKSKLNATPQINRANLSKSQTRAQKGENTIEEEEIMLPVEQRLLRKGEEYKNKKVQLKLNYDNQASLVGPSFKPQLLSNSAQYLPLNGSSRHQVFNKRLGDEMPPIQQNMSTYEMLYYEAIASMVTKQQKVVAKQEEESQARKPHINQKSRLIAQNRKLEDLYENPKKSDDFNEEKSSGFIDANSSQRNKQSMSSLVINKEQTEVNLEALKEQKAKIEKFLNRNYDNELKKRSQIEQKLKQDQERALMEAKKSAKPRLCQGTESLIKDGQQRNGSATFEDLYQKAKIIQLKKDEQARQHMEKVLDRERSDTTFQPKINQRQSNEYVQNISNFDQNGILMNKNYSKFQAKNSSYAEKYYRKQLYKEITSNPDLFSDFHQEYRSADLFNDILTMRMQNLVQTGGQSEHQQLNNDIMVDQEQMANVMGQGLTQSSAEQSENEISLSNQGFQSKQRGNWGVQGTNNQLGTQQMISNILGLRNNEDLMNSESVKMSSIMTNQPFEGEDQVLQPGTFNRITQSKPQSNSLTNSQNSSNLGPADKAGAEFNQSNTVVQYSNAGRKVIGQKKQRTETFGVSPNESLLKENELIFSSDMASSSQQSSILVQQNGVSTGRMQKSTKTGKTKHRVMREARDVLKEFERTQNSIEKAILHGQTENVSSNSQSQRAKDQSESNHNDAKEGQRSRPKSWSSARSKSKSQKSRSQNSDSNHSGTAAINKFGLVTPPAHHVDSPEIAQIKDNRQQNFANQVSLTQNDGLAQQQETNNRPKWTNNQDGNQLIHIVPNVQDDPLSISQETGETTQKLAQLIQMDLTVEKENQGQLSGPSREDPMQSSNQTFETFGSDTKKRIQTYQRMTLADDAAPQNVSGIVEEKSFGEFQNSQEVAGNMGQTMRNPHLGSGLIQLNQQVLETHGTPEIVRKSDIICTTPDLDNDKDSESASQMRKDKLSPNQNVSKRLDMEDKSADSQANKIITDQDKYERFHTEENEVGNGEMAFAELKKDQVEKELRLKTQNSITQPNQQNTSLEFSSSTPQNQTQKEEDNISNSDDLQAVNRQNTTNSSTKTAVNNKSHPQQNQVQSDLSPNDYVQQDGQIDLNDNLVNNPRTSDHNNDSQSVNQNDSQPTTQSHHPESSSSNTTNDITNNSQHHLNQTPKPNKTFRTDRTLSQIEEEASEDGYSQSMIPPHSISQQGTPLTPNHHNHLLPHDKSLDNNQSASPAAYHHLNTSGNLSRSVIMNYTPEQQQSQHQQQQTQLTGGGGTGYKETRKQKSSSFASPAQNRPTNITTQMQSSQVVLLQEEKKTMKEVGCKIFNEIQDMEKDFSAFLETIYNN